MARYEIIKPDKPSLRELFNSVYTPAEAAALYMPKGYKIPKGQDAWDVVRLGKWGALDSAGSQPSQAKMEALAEKDQYVQEKRSLADMAKPRVFRIESDGSKTEVFGKEALDQIQTPRVFEKDKNGIPVNRMQNFRYIFEHDPDLQAIKGYDMFSETIRFSGPVAWDYEKQPGDEWKGRDEDMMAQYLEAVYNFKSTTNAMPAMLNFAYSKSFHEVRDWIAEPVWDGVPRIDSWLIDYFGADDREYVRMVSRKFFIAAVARIFQPGCKYDEVLTLISSKTSDERGQGIGKSSFLRKLANGGRWFSDTELSFGAGKELYVQIRGAWIYEISEGTIFTSADSASAKAFVAAQQDRYRPPYGKTVESFPRQTVFVITTNEHDCLRDVEDRRYLPVDLHVNRRTKSPFEITMEEIRQMWAEAYAAYQAGEPWHLNAQEQAMAQTEQDDHKTADDQLSLIRDFVERQIPINWKQLNIEQRQAYFAGKDFDKIKELGKETPTEKTMPRTQICAREILCELLGKKAFSWKNYEPSKINVLLAQLQGWEKDDAPRYYGPYGSNRGWHRKATEPASAAEPTTPAAPTTPTAPAAPDMTDAAIKKAFTEGEIGLPAGITEDDLPF